MVKLTIVKKKQFVQYFDQKAFLVLKEKKKNPLEKAIKLKNS